MDIKQSYVHHAVVAQLHRWYLGYKRHDYGLENQLDIIN